MLGNVKGSSVKKFLTYPKKVAGFFGHRGETGFRISFEDELESLGELSMMRG